MTYEEAINRIKEGEPFSEIYNAEWEEAKQKAIEALEKQIPKKPPLTCEIYYCPACYISLGKKNSQGLRYCKNCGQALNWR